MKIRTLLGTSLSAGLLLAGALVSADEPPDTAAGDAQSPAMRIHIDPVTGKKSLPDDSTAGPAAATRAASPSPQAASAQADVAAKTGLPVESQPPVRNADGSLSARVGLQDMQYLVIRIDEDGTRTLSHETAEGAIEDAEPHIRKPAEK